MSTFKWTKICLVLLLGFCSTATSQDVSNWFTKSLDYFSYEKCQFKEKSDITANFYNCLSNKQDNKKNNQYDQYYKGYASYMQGGNNGSSNPTANYINYYNPQNSVSGATGSQTTKKQSSDSWAHKQCSNLQEILRCMPTFNDATCLTEKEKDFYGTINYFFQAQSSYLCSNKERIGEALDKSSCKDMKNRGDIQQQCYSLNSMSLSYNFKVNFEDGKMCNLLNGMRKCEESYYKNCEEEVQAYVQHSWTLPLQATPCKKKIFESMIDTLNKRRKRSVFNNQYGFKTADGNGKQFYQYPSYNSDNADDKKEEKNENDFMSKYMNEMQKMYNSRSKRSVSEGAADLKKEKLMNPAQFNFDMNEKFANNFIGKTKKAENYNKKDATNPIEKNFEINKSFADKFNFFGHDMKKRNFDLEIEAKVEVDNSTVEEVKVGEIPIAEEELEKASVEGSISAEEIGDKVKVEGHEEISIPLSSAQKNYEINKNFAKKFNFFSHGLKKRSTDLGDDSAKETKNDSSKNSKDVSEKDDDIKEVKDDKDDKVDDFMKKIQKMIKDSIKKQMKKEKEDKKKDELKSEKEDYEKEKEKQKKEYETERQKDKEEREKQKEKQKKEYETEKQKYKEEREKERKKYKEERKKQKEEYEKEHSKTKKPTTETTPTAEPKSTTGSSSITESSSTAGSQSSTDSPKTTDSSKTTDSPKTTDSSKPVESSSTTATI